MRYSQETTTSPLNLESSAQPPSVLNLYSSSQPPVFSPPPPYQPEGTSPFYPPSSHIFSSFDVRRLGATSSNSSSGMAQGHRAQLPHPGTQVTPRELYPTTTPTFRRTGDHSTRSPTFSSLRRHPLSPSPSAHTYNPPFKMDPNSFTPKPTHSIPPLGDMTSFGTLHYSDGPGAGSPVKLEINGNIDKGFFLAEDSEWTCYRRNYFSCICSFTLSPHYPNAGMTFLENGSSRNLPVHGFAMSISAVVSDNDTHVIELVQHTPKRDKGPTSRPEKTRLKPKSPQPSHHNMNMYSDSGMPVSNRYDHGYGPPPPYPTEHTFERIQFKQATANNGKRRAAQQFYHLLVELWADVGTAGGSDPFVRVAFRKSAKMIVRGRSPGHYQSERRGSTSSGPGGSAGSLGYGGSQVMGSDFGGSSGSAMLSGAYGNTYDPRTSNHYGGGARHHQPTSHHQSEMELDHQVMSTDEVKAITETKDYQYYPTPICDNAHDPRQPVELFSHSSHRGENDNVLPHIGSGPGDLLAKVKQDPGSHDQSHIFYTGNSFCSSRCSRFEGKPTSSGYYPAPMLPASSISMS